MAILTQRKILNVIPGTAAQLTVHCSQSDVGSTVEFELYAGSVPFEPDGTASVQGIRKDGTGFGPEAVALDGSTATVTLSTAMTGVAGPALCEITITETGGSVSTANFALLVEEAAFPNGPLVNNSVDVYQQILQYVQSFPASAAADATAKVAAEAALRQAADQALQASIDAEATARAAAVSAEASARQAADTQLQTEISGLQNAVGGPNVAATVAAMTDTSKVYVYTGSEAGYTAGNWYYWNGSAWVSGGVYNSTAVQTDPTLSVPGMAADAAACGDLKSAVDEIINKNLLEKLTYISGYINTIGDVTTSDSYFTSDYFSVKPDTVYRSGRIRYIAWYSSNSLSGYLSQISIGSSAVTDNTFVSPENAIYARVTLYADDYNSGNYELHENYNWLTEKTLSSVKEEILQKANLLDDTNITFTANQYHTNGNPVSNTSYGFYAYIPVVANAPYIIGPRVRFVELYDTTKTFVKNISVSASAQTGPQVVTPDQDGFLIVTVYMEDDDYYVNDGVYPVGVDYILNERYRLGYSTLKYINEYLKELTVDERSTITIYNFGDSIAAGDGNNNKGYAELIALEWGCACTDYAVGGSTLSRVTGQSMGAILDQIENASGTAPDIILLEGGANDYTQFRVMGEVTGETIFDSAQFDETEYIGALETAFYKLQTKYSGVPIIWIYTHRENTRTEKTDPGTGVMVNFTTMHNKSLDACAKWAIPVVDMYNDGGLNTNWAPYRNAYTNNGDGTHPNEAGYKKFYLPLITAKIKELLQL